MNALYDEGVKVDDIAKRMNVARSSVYRMIELNFEYTEKQNREPLLNSDEEYSFVEAAENDRNLTATELSRDNDLNKKGVSSSTV